MHLGSWMHGSIENPFKEKNGDIRPPVPAAEMKPGARFLTYKELSKKFKDRDDKDIDNDGDTDDSDEYLHKRRQTIQKAIDVRPETARVRRSSSRNDQARRRTKPAPPNQHR